MSVLIATNGSAHAEAAVRLGAEIARRARVPLTILTVIRHDIDRPTVSADAVLARACEMVKPQFAPVRTRVRKGHPAIEIVREAEEGNYAVAIVGERQNRNLLTRFLVGSTAIRVVEHAPCPVIVAKGEIRPIQRMLLCDSGSRDPLVGLSRAAGPSTGRQVMSYHSVLRRFVSFAVELLDGSDEIVVLHVMSQMSAAPGVMGRQLRGDTEALISERTPEGELLRRDVEALASQGIRAHPKVRHGLVVEEILDEVQTGDYDLVVIGAYRGEGWQRILLDDLTHRLVVELDRPVLVVR